MEKEGVKGKLYSRRNNVEVSDISHKVNGESLEDKVINKCNKNIELKDLRIGGLTVWTEQKQ